MTTVAQLIRRSWVAAAALLMIGLLVGAAVALARTPQYRAGITVSFAQSGRPGQILLLGGATEAEIVTNSQLPAYAALAGSSTVTRAVVHDLHLAEQPQQLAGRIATKVSPDDQSLDVLYTDPDRERAVIIDKAVAAELVHLVTTSLDRGATGLRPVVFSHSSVTVTALGRPWGRGLLAGGLIGLAVAVLIATSREIYRRERIAA